MNSRIGIQITVLDAIHEVIKDPNRVTTEALQSLLQSLGVAGTIACEQSSKIRSAAADRTETLVMTDYEEAIAWSIRCQDKIDEAEAAIWDAVQLAPVFVNASV